AGPIDGARLFDELAARHPDCRAFLVAAAATNKQSGLNVNAPAATNKQAGLNVDARAAFVGAAPELLFRLEGRELRAEAVAGSAAPAEAMQLPGRQKDLREHRSVVQHIVEGLGPLSESLSCPPEPGLRALA